MSEIAAEFEVSEQTIYTWRRQARIDTGLEAGVTTSEQAELAAGWNDQLPGGSTSH